MWQSIAYTLQRGEDWVVGLRPMIPLLPSKLGLRLQMWVLSQLPVTYLESGKYLSSKCMPVQISKTTHGRYFLEELSNQCSSQVESHQDISEIADKIKSNAISRLLFCVDEPHGIDTRVTLTTEECHALLAILDARSIVNANSKRTLNATGKLPRYAGVYYMQGAVERGIKRISHVRHIQQDSVRSRHF